MIDVTKYIVKTEDSIYYVDIESLYCAIQEQAGKKIEADPSISTDEFCSDVLKLTIEVANTVTFHMLELTGILDDSFKYYLIFEVGRRVGSLVDEGEM